VYTPAIQFNTIDFVQTPDCGYTLDYTIQIKDTNSNTYTPLPDWLTIVGFLSFDAFTNDPTNVGLYELSIIGSVPVAFMDPVYSEELLIDVKVNDGCEDDEVTNLTSILD